MAGETMRARGAAGRGGFFNNLLALFNALALFAESRLSLLAKESKAALVQMLVLVACLVAALMFFAFGYIFLIASLVVEIARVAQVPWLWIALGAAGLHFLFALICLLIAQTRISKPPFPELSAELKKDREWLKSLDQTSGPTN
jgi:uncharacterized membrane protein YqjE